MFQDLKAYSIKHFGLQNKQNQSEINRQIIEKKGKLIRAMSQIYTVRATGSSNQGKDCDHKASTTKPA